MTRHTELDARGRNSEEAFAHFAGGKAEAIPMLPVIPRTKRVTSRGNRWGVILAGGDGLRLRPLTHLICGDDRPKQFCPLFGGRTLLGQTLRRSEQTIPREQLLVSLSGHHSKWYSREADLLPSQRVVQPANRGTAPPILHSLLSLAQLDAQALVATSGYLRPRWNARSRLQLNGLTLLFCWARNQIIRKSSMGGLNWVLLSGTRVANYFVSDASWRSP